MVIHRVQAWIQKLTPYYKERKTVPNEFIFDASAIYSDGAHSYLKKNRSDFAKQHDAGLLDQATHFIQKNKITECVIAQPINTGFSLIDEKDFWVIAQYIQEECIKVAYFTALHYALNFLFLKATGNGRWKS